MRTITTLALSCAMLHCEAQTYSLSPVFGDGGSVITPVTTSVDKVSVHALTPNGKMLMAGAGNDGFNDRISLVQFDTICGALDPTFGNGGSLVRVFQTRTATSAIAIQPDGHIVGCGMIAPDNSGSTQWPGVFRLKPNGDVDSTFNGIGYHRLQFNGNIGDFSQVFIHDDSTITCTGGNSFSIGAYRFKHNGDLDSTFGVNGAAVLPGISVGQANSAAGLLLADGSVISIMSSWPGVGNALNVVMAKFDGTGVPDPDFGSGGLVLSVVPVNFQSGLDAKLQPDGRILVCGHPYGTGDDSFMARFLPNGDPDPSYGTSGVNTITQLWHRGNGGMQLLPDGSTIQFGQYITPAKGILIKRNANGQADATFGNNGVLLAGTSSPDVQVFLGGLYLPSGRVIAYGYSNWDVLAVKLTPDLVEDALPVITLVGADLITSGSGTFEWFLNGNVVPGATGNAHTPAQNGDYTVTMTLSPDCIFTSDPYTLINVGDDELDRSSLMVLNNPTADLLVVMNNGANMPFDLLDTQGRRITSGILLNGRNAIDLSSAARGIYYVRAVAHGSRNTFRIVKN